MAKGGKKHKKAIALTPEQTARSNKHGVIAGLGDDYVDYPFGYNSRTSRDGGLLCDGCILGVNTGQKRKYTY